MSHLLTLRGRHALSAFRVAKLQTALAASRPDHAVTGLSATYWHFIEVERALTRDEHATLERLLTYGPHDDVSEDGGEVIVVVPRPGTVSPWSSKATDIAKTAASTRSCASSGAWISTSLAETLSATSTAPRCCRCFTTG
jgi:phosphoribosylformylglycinamidine synthase